MKRILVANRGEIACRVVQACRNLGIESVAIYTEADARSLHVLQADLAVKIGPSSPSLSYLNQNAVIHVAQSLECDAIHPGYGFLSENPSFVERCESEGVQFIGPSADSIRRMGDKAQAREEALQLGIDVVPGSNRSYCDPAAAAIEAAQIGFPVLIKARGGGGGRGMRVVDEESQFAAEFVQAAKEAQSAFGDSALYLEKFLTRIRHIEVQILGDRYGNVIALGERDCTVQRRYQKLVEESPCPVISNAMRESLLASAEMLGKSIGYRGAGTVEFIVSEDLEQMYFIEMNARIQVEHPVTEVLFGIDLIDAQLKLAMGARVLDVVGARKQIGHAVEFRINAENWRSGFQPSPGMIRVWRPPAGTGIRVDTHLYESFRISPYYDSLIAKLIIHGHDRNDALERARLALDDFAVGGVATTINFHRCLLEEPAFLESRVSTKWVEDSMLNKYNAYE